jgi:rhodanese-related sulfurtransferase
MNSLLKYTVILLLCGFFVAGVFMEEANALSVFNELYGEAELKDGVRMISYDELLALRSSGEEYILIDVLSQDSFNEGHIAGAESFPMGDITAESVVKRLNKEDNIIVYCGSFMCHASTKAAETLTSLGYKVLDYKGGLKEWKDKGNNLVQA